MRILITGVCGFVGSTLAREFAKSGGHQVQGIDNFVRPGSETNREDLKRLGIRVVHGDVRSASDFEGLPPSDWVIDAAANPSVLAGIDGQASSRQIVEHNLAGTLNTLEYCKRHKAGLILLSTSRVYSFAELGMIPVTAKNDAFQLDGAPKARGLNPEGIDESFSTLPPLSLYGATKLASETMSLEYGADFDFPVFINRCGVLAGAGQFGRPDQGILAFWINAWLRRAPLRYIGFRGQGHQVRDFLDPRDIVPLLEKQFDGRKIQRADRIVNVSGGTARAMSLKQLSQWCARRFGDHEVASDREARTFDIPWLVLDSSKAQRIWGWQPKTPLLSILEEIAAHAEKHPEWLTLSAP